MHRASTVALMIVCPAVLAAIAIYNSSSAQTTDPRYSAIGFPGVTPGSQVFCGKNTMMKWNSTTQQQEPNTPFVNNVGGTPQCIALGSAKGWANVSPRPATRVEVRGWILLEPPGQLAPVSTGISADVEQEYRFSLSLDIGWAPDPQVTAAGIVPINSPQAIVKYIPAFNVPQFAGRTFPEGKVWGGLGAAVLHVEYNGWGPSRVFPANFPNIDASAPAGWMPMGTFQGQNVYWPFTPNYRGGDRTNFSGEGYVGRNTITSTSSTVDSPPKNVDGDYVRIVGLLWEDEPHLLDCSSSLLNPQDPENPSGNCGAWYNINGADASGQLNCWDDQAYHKTRGWAELHSIDYMTSIPSPSTPHPVAAYTSCLSGTQSVGFKETVVPVKPFANSFIQTVPEVIAPESFNTHVPGLSRVDASSFDVTIVQVFTSAFYGVYEVVWGCTPNQCGPDDGCGNFSSTLGCSIGYTCSAAGTCACNAPGYAWCTNTNDCRTTATCPSCPSGMTLCSGQCVNLASDRNNCGACGNVCYAPQGCYFGGICSCSPGTLSCCGGDVCTSSTRCPTCF